MLFPWGQYSNILSLTRFLSQAHECFSLGGNTATYFDLFVSQVKEMNAIPCGGNAATYFNLLIYYINYMDAIPFGGAIQQHTLTY